MDECSVYFAELCLETCRRSKKLRSKGGMKASAIATLAGVATSVSLAARRGPQTKADCSTCNSRNPFDVVLEVPWVHEYTFDLHSSVRPHAISLPMNPHLLQSLWSRPRRPEFK